ncbi:GntR family transcriptional regulator [Companilactobacillus crustorum]|uniref:GntR family transcriptional regulator n=1 Tax=Companilactobacillus crustorum TaxID=392416 RepID=UPI0009579611|nr:GntR family transcriptional regulator [Companilactobacillus crustorum]APU72239.1 hypothetical protein BI355_1940 [Companilactobacillus crustorum]WDT65702.1 GntR family transcriptional regulator [Companilactobacillus crustorum]
MAYKYKEVANELRRQIQNGKYRPGELIPDQNKIAEDFCTTRITVHKALQLLMIEGMIYSKRGAGTFVRKDYSIDNSINGKISPSEQLLGTTETNAGKSVTSKLLELSARIPSYEEAENLLIQPTVPVYVIRRIRYLNDKVFAYERTIMPTSITTLTEDVLKSSVYSHLKKEGFNIEGSHRIVSAKKASQTDIDTGIAEKIGEPVLVINQLSYLDDGQPFEISESRFPYQNSKLTADITL